MQAVLETDTFSNSAKTIGLTESERHEIATRIGDNPKIGDLIKGTGGARKRGSRGRAGARVPATRVITCFAGGGCACVPSRCVRQGGTNRPHTGGTKRIEKASRRNRRGLQGCDAVKSLSHFGESIMTKAGTRLIQSAKEAAAIARGDAVPAHSWVPADVEVRDIRHKLDLSQDEFASEFGFTINQIRDWEQGRSRPLGAMRAYLLVIDRDPDGIRKLLKHAMRRAA